MTTFTEDQMQGGKAAVPLPLGLSEVSGHTAQGYQQFGLRISTFISHNSELPLHIHIPQYSQGHAGWWVMSLRL